MLCMNYRRYIMTGSQAKGDNVAWTNLVEVWNYCLETKVIWTYTLNQLMNAL